MGFILVPFQSMCTMPGQILKRVYKGDGLAGVAASPLRVKMLPLPLPQPMPQMLLVRQTARIAEAVAARQRSFLNGWARDSAGMLFQHTRDTMSLLVRII
eukprot:gnl/TRDRNA2_/TRDRNA2_122990_c0_seq1.p2 gnl/TRDRNA2_/TRDRNA2_122990_c0~~gnl/TRDRNA2_/TRDRNA2_122990_c0_seq1.p2  ORF type:complete len:100 (+),score=12.39 gnl/TRDRNA2_/TRDRNA2_122990_c0_seq1:237-536(+)